MILICYDGSEDARAAVRSAGALFSGQAAIVLTVWQPYIQALEESTLGFGMVPPLEDSAAIDKASRQRAEEIAHEGAELAEAAGLDAEPRAGEQASTPARAILGEAEKLAAEAIVMGSRGRTGLKSLVLGSVSHEVIQHADRTVVVVPSPAVAASRARKVQEDAVAVG
ncbi:MAG TPA: universal stress protein [Solirubrobacteraceae bacterium]|nr:universal stress protein [Solirubrobacteraceae bacterium]